MGRPGSQCLDGACFGARMARLAWRTRHLPMRSRRPPRGMTRCKLSSLHNIVRGILGSTWNNSTGSELGLQRPVLPARIAQYPQPAPGDRLPTDHSGAPAQRGAEQAVKPAGLISYLPNLYLVGGAGRHHQRVAVYGTGWCRTSSSGHEPIHFLPHIPTLGRCSRRPASGRAWLVLHHPPCRPVGNRSGAVNTRGPPSTAPTGRRRPCARRCLPWSRS